MGMRELYETLHKFEEQNRNAFLYTTLKNIITNKDSSFIFIIKIIKDNFSLTKII